MVLLLLKDKNTFKIFRILILNLIKKVTLFPKSSKSKFLFIYQ